MLSVGHLVSYTSQKHFIWLDNCMRTFIRSWDHVPEQWGSAVQRPGESEVVGSLFQSRRNVHDIGFDASVL